MSGINNQPLWLRQLKAIPEKMNRSQHKWLNWGALGYVVFGVLLALTLPEDGFNRFPLVDTFCSTMESLVPSIEKYEQASNFKNVTRSVLSVMWALVPALVVLIIASLRPKQIPEWVRTDYWRQVIKFLLLSIVAIIFCGALIYFFVVMPVDIQAKVDGEFISRGIVGLKAMSHSRFWLGMMGGGVSLAVALFIWFLVAYVYALALLVFGFFWNIIQLFTKKGN